MKNREKLKCPYCDRKIDKNLGTHIKKFHGKDRFKEAVVNAKKKGIPDSKIGEMFNITFRELEKIITEKFGINISIVKEKKIKNLYPKGFKPETTTVWSFKSRGNWATHDGRYRGNWSPYIPRNIILRYSSPGDTVLDYFVGGGTTAIEAKLLGRKCIGIDINPMAIELTKKNLNFEINKRFLKDMKVCELDVYTGDAKNLKGIKNASIDLICAHPPYAGIINYSVKIEGDLSQLTLEEYLREMEKVAKESCRVLKPGKICAILIGDTRKNKRVVPIGFEVIKIFLKTGFKLKELVIKRQHNCKTTGFWFKRSLKYNFLLLAHEYLPIFIKPLKSRKIREKTTQYFQNLQVEISTPKINTPETTTVWIFNNDNWLNKTVKNLLFRYKIKNYLIWDKKFKNVKEKGLLVVPILDLETYKIFLRTVEKFKKFTNGFSYIAFLCKDVRLIDHTLSPLAVDIENELKKFENLKLKEIVIISIEDHDFDMFDLKKEEDLSITHYYLLLYDQVKNG